MSIEYRESQFELFPGATDSYQRVEKPRFYFSSLTFNFDTVVVLSIVMVMMMVLSFSLGIDRGKRAIIAKITAARQRSLTPHDGPLTNKNIPALNVSPAGNSALKTKIEIPTTPVKNVPLAPNSNNVISPASVKNQPWDRANISAAPLPPQVIETVAENAKGMYTVQIASFKQVKYAHQEANNLKNKGYDIFVLQKGNHFIVGVGRFNQKDEAKVLSSKLKRQYKDCVIRNL